MKKFLLKLAVDILKDKKKRRTALIAIGVALFIVLALPLVTGAGAISALGNIITGIIEFFEDGGDTYVDEDYLLKAFEEGYVLSESEEKAIRITQDDLVYLLQRVHDYNDAGNRTRTITIEGKTIVTEEVKQKDENGDPLLDDDGNEVTVEEETEEYPTMEIGVDNSYFEGLDSLDFRLLYLTCVITTLDRTKSDKVLKSVKPLDADLKQITGYDGERPLDGYMITREDVDKCFSYLTIRYDYYVDLLRDDKDFYSYSECKQLPHIEIRDGGIVEEDDDEDEDEDEDEAEDEAEGETIFYVPYSMLKSGSGAYSKINLYNDSDNTHLIGTDAEFDYDGLVSAIEALFPELKWINYRDMLKELPGGEEMFSLFEEWGQTGYVYGKTEGYAIELTSGMYSMRAGSTYMGGIYDSIGEAAVAWALSVSCHGETTVETAWKYYQDKRSEDGYVDCSALVYRAYMEVGLQWPEELTWANTVTFYDYFMEHEECIIVDHCTDFINMPPDMKIGDIIMRPQMAGYWNPEGNNHVLIYAGKNSDGEDMVVHASSTAGHVHTQTLSSFMSFMPVYKWYSVFRPYAGLSYTYNPVSGLTVQQLLSILDAESGNSVERERNAAEIFLYFALTDSKKSGILPSVTAAQALLESGIGTNDWQSEIALNSNNLFGMKRDLSMDENKNYTWTSTQWGGGWKMYWTTEQDEDGNEYEVEAPFREYDCITQSFTDHHEYLLQAKKGSSLRYPGLAEEKSYRAAAQILFDGGYATDQDYVKKLLDLVARLDLDRYDSDFHTAVMELPSALSGYMSTNGGGSVSAGTETISWNPSWEFADRITQKNIKPVTRYIPDNYNGHTVFVNAGHGGGQSLGSSTPNDPFGQMSNQYDQGGGASAYSATKGYTSGASYSYNGKSYSESSWNLEIATLLKNILLQRGYGVVMARDAEELSNENAVRSIFANATADIHVAIHFNSGGNEGVGYYRPNSDLAKHQNWIKYADRATELGLNLENAIAASVGCGKTSGCVGNLTGNMYSTIPCVYVESANNSQATDLHTKKQAFAEGYANGIDQYFKSHPEEGKFKMQDAAPAQGGNTSAQASSETEPSNFNISQSAKLFVAVSGDSYTSTNDTVYVYFKENGKWKLKFMTRGVHGRSGMSNNRTAGDGTTPIGVWRLNTPFGQAAARSGFPSDYIQVTKSDVWSSETNKLVRGNASLDGEKVGTGSYATVYDYVLDSGFNFAGERGKGSALFLHCTATGKTSTAGCVAIQSDKMIEIMKLYAAAGNGNSYIAQAPKGKFLLIYDSFGLNLSPAGNFK